MQQIVIGLSGHIDHGKTSLIKSLTGKDTDVLADEIKRGMTIDIGFAFYNESITIIDVPGHEKFIKNMLTGVSSIDCAILVIAADDGIMPQTQEHFDILKLLNIKKGIVVITKVDLVDREWLDLIESDIKEFVSGSFFDNSDLVKVSSKNGIGIDYLKSKIENIARSIKHKDNNNFFRLWADRVFTKKGFGTVITGTVSSGSISVGDNIEILPYKITSKVRGLHSHGNEVNIVNPGDRAAINFQNLDKNIVSRGTQVSSIDSMESSRSIIVKFQILDTYDKTVKNNQRLRFYCGTIELMCRILFSSEKKLDPGESCYALLKLENDLSLFKDDKFIIRSYSPMTTIGGGIIIDPSVKGKWLKIREFMDTFNEENGILNFIDNPFGIIYKSNDICSKYGINKVGINNLLNDLDIIRINEHKKDWILSKNRVLDLEKKIIDSIKKYVMSNEIVSGLNIMQIRNIVPYDELILKWLLDKMIKENKIDYKDNIYSIVGYEVELNNQLNEIKIKVVKFCLDKSFTIPSVNDISAFINAKSKDLNIVISFLNSEDEIFILDNSLILHKQVYKEIKTTTEAYLKKNKSISIPEFKKLFNISRKYAVPLLEFLDSQKVTIRSGNDRIIYT